VGGDPVKSFLHGVEHRPCRPEESRVRHVEKVLALLGDDGIELPELPPREKREIVKVRIRSYPPPRRPPYEGEELVLESGLLVILLERISLLNVQHRWLGTGSVPSDLSIGRELRPQATTDVQTVLGDPKAPEPIEQLPLPT
jgi:hypothetical protein